MPTWVSAEDLLLKHSFGDALSLYSKGAYVWYFFYPNVQMQNVLDPGGMLDTIAMKPVAIMTEAELDSLAAHIRSHLNQFQGTLREMNCKLQAYASLDSVARDRIALGLEICSINPYACILGQLEAKIRRPLSDDTREILKPNTSTVKVYIPFCFREYMEVRNAVKTFEGEICYHSLIALPLARLALRAFGTPKFGKLDLWMNSDSVSAPGSAKPHIILSVDACNVFCAVVKPSRDAIDVAWQEAIGHSVLLPLETNHCTVVMGVAGDMVRIGLMTLLNNETVTSTKGDPTQQGAPISEMVADNCNQHGESDSQLLGPLPEEVPVDLHVALQATHILGYQDNVCKRDVKILHGIEFYVHCVNHGLFDTAMSSYFAYVLQSIKDGYKNYKTSPVWPPKKNVLLYIGRIRHLRARGLRAIGCPMSFVVKTMKHDNPMVFEEVHRLIEYSIIKLGTCALTKTTKFGVPGAYITCMLPYVPGREVGNCFGDAFIFAELCTIVLCLHRDLNICHGDLRRPNILVAEGGGPIRLIDWEYAWSITTGGNSIRHDLQTASVFHGFLGSVAPTIKETVERNPFIYWRLVDIYAIFYFERLGLKVNTKDTSKFFFESKAPTIVSEMQSSTENSSASTQSQHDDLAPGSVGRKRLDALNCIFARILTEAHECEVRADRQRGAKAQREGECTSETFQSGAAKKVYVSYEDAFSTQSILEGIFNDTSVESYPLGLFNVFQIIQKRQYFSPHYKYNTVDGLHSLPSCIRRE